jgi:ABC-2 type transport system permease protein
MSLVNASAVIAVAKRQLHSLLGNPLGYIFILAFVVLSGVAIFVPEEFFTRNIADFNLLYEWMPWMLVALLPCLGMNAWASEREGGTEELLLTLPVGILDAILGKYLALAGFFTVALATNLVHVLTLSWLGDPDVGLLLANFLGWWFLGLALSAYALAASVLVGQLAVAFVLGVLFSGAFTLVAVNWLEVLEPFNRGSFSLGSAVVCLAGALEGLAIAVFFLSMRRWRAGEGSRVLRDVLTVVFAIIVAVNLGRIAQRTGLDSDLSVEGLSSLGSGSVAVLAEVDEPVQMTIFMSQLLPDEMEEKRQEVLDKAEAIRRAAGDNVRVKILRSETVYDEYWTTAVDNYGLEPRQVMGTGSAGSRIMQVLFGAAVSRGSKTQLVPFFDAGVSVEYQLIRAIHTLQADLADTRPVLGILRTELQMNGAFDYQTGNSSPAFGIVQEWQRQFEVRDVQPDQPVSDEIDVLVAAVPSSLQEGQLQYLHDWIWAGNPTMLFVDNMPLTNRLLAPGVPRQGPNPFMQQQPPEPKVNASPLLEALGFDYRSSDVLWDDSDRPRDIIGEGQNYVLWSTAADGQVQPHEITAGLQAVVSLAPTALFGDPNRKTEITPLISVNTLLPWGINSPFDYLEPSFMGMQAKMPDRFVVSYDQRQPIVAALVRGFMPHAFGDGVEVAPGEEPDPKTIKRGDLSRTPVNVIVLGDVDMASDMFANLYRNIDERTRNGTQAALASLGNVQFLGNAADYLVGNVDLASVRTRKPLYRSLQAMDDLLSSVNDELTSELRVIEDEIQQARDSANASFQAAIDKAGAANAEGDSITMANRRAAIRDTEQRKLNAALQKLNERYEGDAARIAGKRDAAVASLRLQVKIWAIVLPALAIGLLVLLVWSNRVINARMDVPMNRRRTN